MTVTFEDVVEARTQALRDGRTAVTARVTEDALDEMQNDENLITVTDSEFVPDDDEVIGRVNALDIVEGESNVLVTEDGTEYEL